MTNTTNHSLPVGRKSVRLAAAALAATMFTGVPVLHADEDDHEGDEGPGTGAACSTTARAALKACRNDVRDNYWLAVGKCLNIADDVEREGCLDEAREVRSEEKETCVEQKEARLEVCESLGEAPYDPAIDPADFVDPATIAANPNPYFPLVPGLVRIYEAGEETITVTVTDETKEILGVTCMVVRDVVEVDGEVTEDTVDWYAQDLYGNVWYFGEIAQNFEDGELDNLDGSWKAGKEGGRPGIIMRAMPVTGDLYRQEFLLNEAEDLAEVLDTAASATAPAASCDGTCVLTRDFTPIEPGADENKYFAPGVGNILTINLETGEQEQLVDLIMP